MSPVDASWIVSAPPNSGVAPTSRDIASSALSEAGGSTGDWFNVQRKFEWVVMALREDADIEKVADLEASTVLEATAGAALRTAIRGDCHVHSVWSDGGATMCSGSMPSTLRNVCMVLYVNMPPQLPIESSSRMTG